MIYIAGISISLFAAALILYKKNKSRSDLFLFIWMLVLAFHLYLYDVNFAGTHYERPHLLGIEIPLPLIHGVLLYFYVSSITNQFPKPPWVALLHLVPISIGYLYLIPFFHSTAAQKMVLFNQGFTSYEGFMHYGLLLIFLSGIVYVIWCIILLRKHKRNIRDQFSDIQEVQLSWLQFLTYGLGAIWSIVVCTNNDVYIFSGVAIFVMLIGFFGVQQRTIFVSSQVALTKLETGVIEALDEKKKYARSGLKEHIADDIHEKLMHLFVQEEYFKRNNLSLNELAAELDIHPNYLSQIINEKAGKSFYDFVNTFRLEAFKKMVKDGKNKDFTLLALAYDCGFNSKSSFNRYFKKSTGQTPSNFVKSIVE